MKRNLLNKIEAKEREKDIVVQIDEALSSRVRNN